VAIPTYAADWARSLARIDLARRTPSLRAHQLERWAGWRAAIGAALARRCGYEPEDVRALAVVGAALAALDAAAQRWAFSGGTLDLDALLDEAFDAVAELGHPSPVPEDQPPTG